jgi:putative redox protein
MTHDFDLTFESAGGHELAACLHRPDGDPIGYALFAHCFTGTKDLRSVRRIADTLAEEGIATLRFDFTGLGESEGDFAETTFSSNVQDLLSAAAFLRLRYEAPSVLVGHSLGGAAALSAAHSIPELRAVATIGAPADPEHVTHLFADHVDDIEAKGEAEVEVGGRRFRITKRFIEDLAAHEPLDELRRLRPALLVLHAPEDEVVELENARLIYEAALHPKSFVSLDEGDHLLLRSRDARYAARVLAAWASRYLDVED